MSRLDQGLVLGLILGHILWPNLMSISQVAVRVMSKVGVYGQGGILRSGSLSCQGRVTSQGLRLVWVWIWG